MKRDQIKGRARGQWVIGGRLCDSFGQGVRRERMARQESQRELARAIGVSNSDVSRWESGNGLPSVSAVLLLVAHWRAPIQAIP